MLLGQYFYGGAMNDKSTNTSAWILRWKQKFQIETGEPTKI